MPINHPFDFEYSYLSLPDKFYSLVKPGLFPSPEIFLLNDTLCDELNLPKDQKYGIASLFDEKFNENVNIVCTSLFRSSVWLFY